MSVTLWSCGSATVLDLDGLHMFMHWHRPDSRGDQEFRIIYYMNMNGNNHWWCNPRPPAALAKQAGVTPSYIFARRKLSTSQ